MTHASAVPAIPRKKLPARPYSGNEPLFDQDGYVKATIMAIKNLVQNEGTKDEWQSYQWLLESEGTQRPWSWSELSVKYVRPPNKKGELNRLADLMIKLGMLTLEDVRAEDVPMETLESAIGRVVRFRSHRKEGYYRVDFSTLIVDHA